VYDGADNLMQRFEYADQRMPVAMTQGNQKYYLYYDQVGSLRAISDTSHNIIKEVVYDTFGNVLIDSNEAFKIPFGFAGGLYDVDTKLTRFGYRDYDAYAGKWTAKDPIGFQGGDSNLYGYVLGDPVNFVDPEGLMTKKIDPAEELAKDAYCTAWKTHGSTGCNNVLNISNKACLALGSPGLVKCQRIYKDLFIDCMFERLDCQKKDKCETNSTN